ncbi:M23 family metallopeptidase [Rhodococcus sp. NPDC003382]
MRIVTALAVSSVLWFTAAPGCVPAAHGASPDYDWPLQPRPSVTRPFDPPEHDWLPGHRGVDLSGSIGQVVRSAAAGTVVFAGVVGGKPVVSIDHEGGLRTTYEPVTASVTPGRRIARGEPIGTLEPGHEGCPVAACLHWGLRRDRSDYLDPLPLVRPTVIRLEPV